LLVTVWPPIMTLEVNFWVRSHISRPYNLVYHFHPGFFSRPANTTSQRLLG